MRSFCTLLIAVAWGCSYPPLATVAGRRPRPAHPTTGPVVSRPSKVHRELKRYNIGGVEWQFEVVWPKANEGRPWPVLIALHGLGGNSGDMVRELMLGALAGDKGFILIAPDAQDGQWQDVQPGPLQDRDSAFFKKLLDDVPGLGGDPKRVYVTGFSNGGGMTFWLACHFSERIAAAAGGGASIGALDARLRYYELSPPKRPIPVMIFHGVLDEVNGYDMRTFTIAIPEAAQWWAEVDHLPVTPKHSEIGNGHVLVDRYTGDKDLEVVLYSYKDLGHEWPSASDAKTGLQFNDQLWEFLSRYILP